MGSQIYGKPVRFPTTRNTHLLQYFPNDFQRVDVLSILSSNLVQWLQVFVNILVTY